MRVRAGPKGTWGQRSAPLRRSPARPWLSPHWAGHLWRSLPMTVSNFLRPPPMR